jgi:basic membrane lipoprotein Med (substrate-binding protein (PBP1-ABC) superfamily)
MIRSLKYVGAVGLLLATVITPASARGVSHPSQARQFSVGLVTDVGGLNDRSFNHLAYVGLQRACSVPRWGICPRVTRGGSICAKPNVFCTTA